MTPITRLASQLTKSMPRLSQATQDLEANPSAATLAAFQELMDELGQQVAEASRLASRRHQLQLPESIEWPGRGTLTRVVGTRLEYLLETDSYTLEVAHAGDGEDDEEPWFASFQPKSCYVFYSSGATAAEAIAGAEASFTSRLDEMTRSLVELTRHVLTSDSKTGM